MHYDRMDLVDICQIPVDSVTGPDAHLWLWTTNTHLEEALQVVKSWGFVYKSLLTWVKPRMGTGWWLRSKTEHVILAAKSTRLRANPGNVVTCFEAPYRGPHVKPIELYSIIERLSPAPYLELFARGSERPDWTTLVSEGASDHLYNG